MRTLPRYSAALLTLAAAAIHLAVAPGHLAEYLPYGIFFFGLAFTQVAWPSQSSSRRAPSCSCWAPSGRPR